MAGKKLTAKFYIKKIDKEEGPSWSDDTESIAKKMEDFARAKEKESLKTLAEKIVHADPWKENDDYRKGVSSCLGIITDQIKKLNKK